MRSATKWASALAAVGLIALSIWHIESASQAVLTHIYARPQNPLAITPNPQMVSAGRRLVRINGCSDCHGAGDTGHVVLTGWLGTRLVAPNLTVLAHRLSTQQLAAAIRYGVKPDGRAVISMPAQRFLRQSDADVAAMIAYLQSRPVRPNTAGPTRWGLIGRAMLATGLIPIAAAHLRPEERGPLNTPVTPLALGRYLTHTQCSACHGRHLSGEADVDSPDLRFSIKHYSLAAFEAFFRTGIGQLGHGTSTMTPLIRRRFHLLTTAEVQAIYLYLNHSKAEG